jgi:hypothetical protein
VISCIKDYLVIVKLKKIIWSFHLLTVAVLIRQPFEISIFRNCRCRIIVFNNFSLFNLDKSCVVSFFLSYAMSY